jgi:hypothetical protein
MIEFNAFPKMARLHREVIVTEKIDGTNAQIYIHQLADNEATPKEALTISGGLAVMVGSRNRWITPESDNHGFARWVKDNLDEIRLLGPGRHFGEWWGSGIQRGYNLSGGDKRFSLFNVQRWCLHGSTPEVIPSADPRIIKRQDVLPPCCGLVPTLYRGEFSNEAIAECITRLERFGSLAVEGYHNPEGIIVFHTAANVGFKKTIKDDGIPKSLASTN